MVLDQVSEPNELDRARLIVCSYVSCQCAGLAQKRNRVRMHVYTAKLIQFLPHQISRKYFE